MIRSLFLFLPFSLLAITDLEIESMLFQANEISQLHAPLIAKAPPPSVCPQTDSLLLLAPNWFSIDLKILKTDGRSVLSYLNQENLWQAFAEMGIQAVELKGLKTADKPLVRLQIDPKFGTEEEYRQLAALAMKKGVRLIGSLIGGSTGQGADFALALKNFGAYPTLYSLVEILPQDWELLPCVKPKAFSVNIPWLTLQTLHKKGYVPTDFAPYIKESHWNATEPIRCMDNKIRRWIYLRDEKGFPRLNWLNPSFASIRVAAADALYCMFRLGQPILQMDAEWPEATNETMSLTVRKLGGFSAAFCQGGVQSFANSHSDVLYDHLTPMAALHALITEDAQVLRLLYRLLLEEKIPLKRLVHSLEPFGRFSCDWAEFLQNADKKYQYCAEEVSGESLRKRLLSEDRFRLEGKLSDKPLSGWTEACASMLNIQDLEKKRKLIVSLHLLLAKLFALQPGPFSLSAQDLLGSSPSQKNIDLFGPNNESLYSSLPNQLRNPHSFASQLQTILRVRSEFGIERASLIDVPTPEHKGILILRYRLPDSKSVALLAVNFGKEEFIETIESCEYVQTNARNLLSGFTEKKLFDSSFFELKLDPLSAKLILFQSKYY